jgi:SAM-dependent methyltransferase
MSTPAREIVGIYRRHARTWAEARGKSLVEGAWLEQFCALLPPMGAVLDIGCGSGAPIAKYLTEQSYAVTGVDASPEMIALFEENVPGGTAHVADMRALALSTTYDGLIAWDSFFHLTQDDQRRMFPSFRAHAAPGAALLFTSGPKAGEAMGVMEGEVLYHASLDPEEYRDLLKLQDFDVVAHTAEDAACGGHTVWLARSL